jgi:hypothetical protein
MGSKQNSSRSPLSIQAHADQRDSFLRLSLLSNRESSLYVRLRENALKSLLPTDRVRFLRASLERWPFSTTFMDIVHVNQSDG